jgi:hypothetical protein
MLGTGRATSSPDAVRAAGGVCSSVREGSFAGSAQSEHVVTLAVAGQWR